jgi:N-acetylglucosamine kinase-like BadF-type ATPase
MILIADSGSTKTEWCIVSAEGNMRIKTQGISPYFHTSEDICRILLEELMPSLPEPQKVTEIFYYGTGCTADATINVVRDALSQLFANAKSQITYDLIAAAHALCGSEKGIACILGTGSNSGYYNGHEIERNIPGLGYILGDEGSGAYMGKLLACEYLYDRLDRKLEEKFEEKFMVDKHTLLDKVYSSSLANRLLASFSRFISDNRGHPEIDKILFRGLDDFFSIHIAEYKESKSVPVHFTGSIAWAYRDILRELCKKYSFECGNIIREPMDGLLHYYQQKIK